MTLHELRTWPHFFEAVWDGRKTAELRRDDRGFAVGDIILLQEYEPTSGDYSGREILARVTHIVDSATFGLQDGHVMLSMAILSRVTRS
jgi:ASC-1-like (ASCH) protein